MHYTNKHNLPSTLVSALKKDDYHQDGDISITGLIQPPRIYQLRKRYDDKIIVDISDEIWKVLGKAIHYVLQHVDTDDIITEERLACNIGGWRVTGGIDLYESPSTITDYKITSVWAVLYGLKSEWIQQLNGYAYLYKKANFLVDKLQIVAILRDWSKHQIQKQYKYPRSQAVTLPVPLWTSQQTYEFLSVRVMLHQSTIILDDDDLPECTAEERWDKPESWALMKKGRKSALRVFYKKSDAYADHGIKYDSIEHRPGKRVRCEGYCEVAPFCRYAKGGKSCHTMKNLP